MAPLPIAVLISGGGTTLRNLLEYRDAGKLDVDFRLVISSKPQAYGLNYAQGANIPSCGYLQTHLQLGRRAQPGGV